MQYNRFAGKNLDRLAALSDGVFGVAATLLVLDLRVPAVEVVHSEHDLGRALVALAPRLLPYLMTFMTVGIFWVGQQAQFNVFERTDRTLTWIHIGYLLVVTLMPFSTALLAQFLTYRLALGVYWLNIFLLGVALYVSWKYAKGAGLVKGDVPADLGVAVERRILIAQSLYAFGAALCLINTYVSIGFIVLVQLNYVFAPRIGSLNRI
jgi:TMEM175 potassium channel family protein